MEVFEDRQDAGRRLAEALREDPWVRAALQPPPGGEGFGKRSGSRLVVLAIPRGGLPVGAEVAAALGADFDVVVVRKLRAPRNPELGYGAVGPDGLVERDDELVERLGLTEEQIEEEIADRREAVRRRLDMYRTVAPAVPLEGAVVIVVDDGIATGATARQACAIARRAGAARVLLAAPVAPEQALEELAEAADRVLVLSQPPEFLAVGQAYRDFAELDDDKVLATLRTAIHAG
jgi:putative phosphoribosyl transferase